MSRRVPDVLIRIFDGVNMENFLHRVKIKSFVSRSSYLSGFLP